MKIHEYNQYPVTFNFTLSSPRPEGAASTVIIAAKKHEEWASRVRAAMREFKHIDPTTKQIPPALTLENYFPTHNGSPLYALRTLQPAGSLREIEPDFWLDVYRLRYVALLVFLPAALHASEATAFAIERHLEKAVSDLFDYLNLPRNFLPGEEGIRPEDRSIIDIIVEVGAAEGSPGLYEVPTPTA
jgi:hypothetical protein